MDFGRPLTALRDGHTVTRTSWTDPEMALQLIPGGIGPTVEPLIIFMLGDRTPWTPSQDDLLADDWELLPFGPPRTYPPS